MGLETYSGVKPRGSTLFEGCKLAPQNRGPLDPPDLFPCCMSALLHFVARFPRGPGAERYFILAGWADLRGPACVCARLTDAPRD